MKNEKKKFRGKRAGQVQSLPFRRENYLIFTLGLVIIVFGFIALAQPPWDSFFSLTLAPILLVVGYCVVIPIAILYKKRFKEDNQEVDISSS